MFGMNLGFALAWATPWVLFGFLLMATVFGIPLGIPCLIVGSWPFKAVIQRRIDRTIKWENRDRSYGEEFEEDVPWEM